MQKFINFVLQDNDYSDEIERFQSILKGSGITVDIDRKVSTLGNYAIMTVSYDEANLKRKRTRYAGRHNVIPKGHYTWGDIRELKKEKTNKKLAKELNISVRTLYRRLRDSENEPDEELFI